MSARKKKRERPSDDDSGGFIFSTNPDFSVSSSLDEERQSPDRQYLEAHVEKKGRNGKQVVLIKGFSCSAIELAQWAKELKQHCGVGGSAKGTDILLQGAVREKATDFLKSKGHSVKRVGG
ncbi:MAG: translation initiation factor [Flavobacteriia bacterium]|nr:translation initiation factor [Flavobacteriia bacterium]